MFSVEMQIHALHSLGMKVMCLPPHHSYCPYTPSFWAAVQAAAIYNLSVLLLDQTTVISYHLIIFIISKCHNAWLQRGIGMIFSNDSASM